jgi:hypothetical protein
MPWKLKLLLPTLKITCDSLSMNKTRRGYVTVIVMGWLRERCGAKNVNDGFRRVKVRGPSGGYNTPTHAKIYMQRNTKLLLELYDLLKKKLLHKVVFYL